MSNLKQKLKTGGIIAVAVIIILALDYGLSWIVTCGIIKLITMCFGLTFKWSIATGIWLIIYILKSVFNIEDLEDQLNKAYRNHNDLLSRVVETLEKRSCIDMANNTSKSQLLTDKDVDKWDEYNQLDEQGRLIKLPCKVGDVVYTYCGEFGILEYEVDSIVIDKHITYQCSAYSEPIGDCPSECLDEIEPGISDFGKTVFLTESEAEEKLKELRDREDE